MRDAPGFVTIAALIGDPARAIMLNRLMGGTALTASELAAEAGVGLGLVIALNRNKPGAAVADVTELKW